MLSEFGKVVPASNLLSEAVGRGLYLAVRSSAADAAAAAGAGAGAGAASGVLKKRLRL